MYEDLVKSLRTGHDKYFARDMEAADAIEKLSRLHEAQRQSLITLMNEDPEMEWIPVTERLPEKKKAHYLCYLDDDSIAVCYWSNISIHGSKWEWHNPNWKDVTHWMPLPEPPKKGE